MNRTLRIFNLLMVGFLMWSGSAFGDSFGANITIWDQRGVAYEDNEVEPGMIDNQSWDLEGFFWDGKLLTMVGGFDFKDGNTYASGDIFLDIDGDVSFGSGATNDNFSGYDYVLDLNISSGTFNVIELVEGVVLIDVLDYNSPESSYWRYDDENSDSNFTALCSGSLTYYDNLTDTGFLGDYHNAVSVDLGLDFLKDKNFTAHFTMECGNDNLMGSTAPVPEPATMLLFGTGLIGMSVVGRKKFHKRS